MDNHLRQVAHNESLLDYLERSFPNSYNDWKVTLVFYASLHLIRAYATFSNVNVGASHHELYVAMKNQGASIPNLDVDMDCTNSYASLYSASRLARYDGIRDFSVFEQSNRKRLNFSKIKLEKIKGYLHSKGLPI